MAFAWVAAPLSAVRIARLCLAARACRSLCRRVLLARLPGSWPGALDKSALLAQKARGERQARQRSYELAKESGLGRRARLAMRPRQQQRAPLGIANRESARAPSHKDCFIECASVSARGSASVRLRQPAARLRFYGCPLWLGPVLWTRDALAHLFSYPCHVRMRCCMYALEILRSASASASPRAIITCKASSRTISSDVLSSG